MDRRTNSNALKTATQRVSLKIGIIVVAVFTFIAPLLGSSVSANSGGSLEQMFSDAAREFNVPKEVVMAVAYTQSRWEDHNGSPSASGGYGIMHLTSPTPIKDERGDKKRPSKGRMTSGNTMAKAAKLLNTSSEALKNNTRQNIRGGAALLAFYAKKLNSGKLPDSDNEWYGAVAKLGDQTNREQAIAFANSVYKTIKRGASHTTTEGQHARIHPKMVSPNRDTLSKRYPSFKKHFPAGAECPHTLNCKFVPASHTLNNPDDKLDYGNYDTAHRDKDMQIKYIVLHDTEGSYQSAIDHFQDPKAYVSAHYVIRSSDGEVTQMVPTKDVAWHAGNWYMNMHSIGIEHEGFAAEGATWYTDAMYQSSAKLVRHLAKKYNIPLDREHIIGHDQYHGTGPGRIQNMHTDPGPFWDWERYMDLLDMHDNSWYKHHKNGGGKRAITISPKFSENKPPVEDCSSGSCQSLPAQSANFVQLRTEPSEDAPLLSDIGLHPDGAPGTKNIADTSATATYGQRFGVADRKGDWTAIWFSGQKAWFYNKDGKESGKLSYARVVQPKEGKESIPVYGAAYPETTAFPSTIPPANAEPLEYTIPAGQKYVAYDPTTPTDYFYAMTFDRSLPDDGSVVIGNERYIPIAYNHRQAYVKASDVSYVR